MSARRKRNRKQSNETAARVEQREPWYKRAWIVASGLGVLLTAAVLNGPALLKNARELPAELRQTHQEFRSWVKEDAAWTGYWTSFPEGLIGMDDLQLSKTEVEVTIWAKGGVIDGTIATRQICESLPFFDYLLLRGEVSGDRAKVTAWDLVLGEVVDYGELELVRADGVLTVQPLSGRIALFPETVRLAVSPGESDPEPDMEYCDEKRPAVMP